MNSIFLKALPDGTVKAFGDVESLKAPAETGGGDGVYHATVTVQQWDRAGHVAHVEDGRIVLGKSAEDVMQEQAEAVRRQRDIKLRACDKISPMRWNAMTEAQRQAWTKYRQDLLNIPQHSGFPWNGDVDAVPWPVQPE